MASCLEMPYPSILFLLDQILAGKENSSQGSRAVPLGKAKVEYFLQYFNTTFLKKAPQPSIVGLTF